MMAKSLEMFAAQIPNIVKETVSACLAASTNQRTINDGSDNWIPKETSTATTTAEAPNGRYEAGTIDLSNRPTSVRISALPSRLIGQIARGEFVNFNTILAATAQGPDAASPITVYITQDKWEPQAIALPPTQPQGNKINSFENWLAAWNLYVSALAHFNAVITPYSSITKPPSLASVATTPSKYGSHATPFSAKAAPTTDH